MNQEAFPSAAIVKTTVCVVTLSLGLAQVPAAAETAAEMYRWVDADGKLHISDTKPQHGDYQRVEQQRLPAANSMQKPVVMPHTGKKTASKRNGNPPARVKKKRLNCSKYERRLAAVQQRLRSGYREPAGNKLRAQRREYRDLLINCRRNQ